MSPTLRRTCGFTSNQDFQLTIVLVAEPYDLAAATTLLDEALVRLGDIALHNLPALLLEFVDDTAPADSHRVYHATTNIAAAAAIYAARITVDARVRSGGDREAKKGYLGKIFLDPFRELLRSAGDHETE